MLFEHTKEMRPFILSWGSI